VKAILARPQSEWRIVCRESGEPADLFIGYVAALALIPALARFIGGSIIGVVTQDGIERMPVLSGLVAAVFGYLLTFVVVYLVALLINALAPSFGGRRDAARALKLAVYSYTPYWLAGIFMLVPGLRFLTVLGVYGAYLMFVGTPVAMQVPRSRAGLFVLAVAALAVWLAIMVGVAQSTIFALPRGS
jgi:hypothetical protein